MEQPKGSTPPDNEGYARTGYQAAVALWNYEGSTTWARFNVMLVANSIVLGVIAVMLTGQRMPLAIILAMCIAGAALCIVWALLMARGFGYQTYWILSARELEENNFGGVVTTVSRGSKFADGEEVTFRLEGDDKHRMSFVGRIPARCISCLVIIVFLALYVYLLILVSLRWDDFQPSGPHRSPLHSATWSKVDLAIDYRATHKTS